MTRIAVYPTQRDPTLYTAFLVALTSLEASSPSGQDTLTSEQFPIAVVLDSGTTLSYLPTDLAKQIWKEVGAQYVPMLGVAVIPCNFKESEGHFSFGFAGPKGPRINVTMDELVLNLVKGTPPKFPSGVHKGLDMCQFGIQNFTQAPYLLGDTFLRSAYVVYDLINNQIGIAATDFNSTDSNIVPFPSLSAQIPSATVAPDQKEATAIPKVTEPAYNAGPGFQAVTSGGGGDGDDENAAPQTLVAAVAMSLTALGAGLFLAT